MVYYLIADRQESAMKSKMYQIRMNPEQVEGLRQLARRLAYERGKPCTWAELTRQGADLILQKNGVPGTAEGMTDLVAAGGER